MPFYAFANWEDVTPQFTIKSSVHAYSADVEQTGNTFVITSHQSPLCYNVDSTKCRKGLVAYNRNKFDTSKIRRHSFYFTLDYAWFLPEFLIITQDWVGIYTDDLNGNPPITTVKLRSYSGKLYLQHWDNAWQWLHDPADFDQHLVPGRERMNGEVEIQKGQTYFIELYIQDMAEGGNVQMFIDGVKISDSNYRASHLTSAHTIQTGMYWSKGFNLEHDQTHKIIATYSDIKHEVLRLNFGE